MAIKLNPNKEIVDIIKKGLKKNNEPNKIGFELEELNDKFIFALQQFDLKK